MLTSIIRAPAEMLKHVKVYGLLLILTGLHGVLYLLNADVLGVFTDGSASGILFTNDSFLQLRALGLIVISLTFSVYSMGIVSREMRKTTSEKKNSLFFSSIAFSLILIAVALGLVVVLNAINSLSASGGMASLLSVIFTAIIGLTTALCVIKFSFAPVYVGMGFLPKDALAQSWSATRGKLLSTIILLLAILIVAGFIQGVTGLVAENIADESILAIVFFVGSALGLFYSGTTLALAAPEPGALSVRRGHGKK